MGQDNPKDDSLKMEPLGPNTVKVGDYDASIPSIFDIEEKDGKYLMPFNPVDYGDDNSIIRQCNECRKELPQGKMKELDLGSGFGSGTDSLYAKGIFICRECWFETYADASKWIA